MRFVKNIWMSALILTLLVVFTIPSGEVDAKTKWEVKADKVISEAKKHLNKKYKSGANGPNTFDCSGYTQYVWKRSISYKLHRNSGKQSTQGKTISIKKIRKGDLLFFNTNNKGISHVAIYLGNGKMIQSASSKNVSIASLNNSYWKPRLVKARRLINL
ncbi:Cell wall-associated hydrolase, NlpC family [Seinonella peptonophila]|uniref:Cell wall-associated hydrolase, NlpC family n=1 Tax=Seinonella peptonophila TaxID=112248 RepID=A0A1M4WJS7_9BACL|nr:C40 family peptidase [Seinonella peptonophila]SHE81466.1 Cell wall-associated hydrolase, NlpC family [Seinonella peptonophila]